MSIYLSGKKTDPIIWVGGDVDAVYIGDTKVWPDTSSMAGGIELELPRLGDENWAVWWHTLRYHEMMQDAACIKFTVDGVDYFINTIRESVEQVKLIGNVLELTSEQKRALSGKIGDTLTVELSVPSNSFGYVRSNEERVAAMPFLTLSTLNGDFELSEAVEYGSFSVEVIGVPSGTVHWRGTVPIDSTDEVGKRGKWSFTRQVRKNNVVVGDVEAYYGEEVPGDYGTRVQVVTDNPAIAVRAAFWSTPGRIQQTMTFKVRKVF